MDDQAFAALSRLPASLGVDAGSARITRLGGGTNRNFRVDAGAHRYVLRLAGPATAAYIDREREAQHARAAHAAGVSPALLHADAATGTALFEYAPLPAVSRDAMSGDRALLGRCARLLRRLHREASGFVAVFDPFERIDTYLAALAELDGAAPAGYGATLRDAEPLRALARAADAAAPCHVDPDCANFLDDGARTLLVDWEYSGLGDPLWDLADLSRENGLGPEADTELLRAYFGAAPAAAVAARFALYKPLCDLMWAAWCSLQTAAGNDTGDWDQDARRRVGAARDALGADGFGSLIARATGNA